MKTTIGKTTRGSGRPTTSIMDINNSMKRKIVYISFIVVAIQGLQGVEGRSSSLAHKSRQLDFLQAEEEICRGEDVCIKQGLCSKFEYELDSAGASFPYNVRHTSTGGYQSTSFVFMVCSNAIETYGGCSNETAGCSGLASFKIRTKDEYLEVGRTIDSVPAGYEWASCDDHGPGHVWEGYDLGKLENSPADGDACETFTVTLPKDATLGDLCEQGIEIVDNSENVVYKQPSGAPSCFYTLESLDGSSAYGSVLDTRHFFTNQAPTPTAYGPTGRKLRIKTFNMPGRLF